MDIRNVQDIVTATLSEGGVTIDPVFFTQPTDGYAVGGLAESVIISADALTAAELLGWFHDVADVLFGTPNAHLGTWLDHATNLVHLDVAEVVYDRDDAILRGHARGELAIYDLASDAVIAIDHESEV